MMRRAMISLVRSLGLEIPSDTRAISKATPMTRLVSASHSKPCRNGVIGMKDPGKGPPSNDQIHLSGTRRSDSRLTRCCPEDLNWMRPIAEQLGAALPGTEPVAAY